MKYYAVKKGRTSGIFNSWDDAKKQIDGYSGAEYKSFKNLEDADNYLNSAKKESSQPSSKPASEYFATIYTDGGSRNTGVHKGGHVNKTDKAAWAYRIEWNDDFTYGSGGEFGATNNKMELLGLINALEKLIELNFNTKHLLFVLDSQYVLNGINKNWIEGWKKRGWKKANGPLINAPEWQKLDNLLKHFPNSKFSWTKGHADNQGNIFVDHELNKYMDNM